MRLCRRCALDTRNVNFGLCPECEEGEEYYLDPVRVLEDLRVAELKDLNRE